jgi:peptidyl-prolyl cis-trans isomerase A (cyclophilin A)
LRLEVGYWEARREKAGALDNDERERIRSAAMKNSARLWAAVLLSASGTTLALLVARAGIAQTTEGTVVVVLETERGEIEVSLDARHAPATTANFLRYMDRGFYDGGVFHRTVKPDNQADKKIKIEVIQAGINPVREKEGRAPIALERTSKTGLKHLDGTISMARDGPDTATSDFFICIGDQPELDFGGRRNPDGQGFAAFGRVVRGMEVVRAIQQSPAEGQALKPPIKILKAARK